MYQNEHLNVLVQELSKKSPNRELLKDKTALLKIPFSEDLIILMSEILCFISKNEKKLIPIKEKTHDF